MNAMLTAAKAAKFEINRLTTAQKNQALAAMADALEREQEAILAANALDLEQALSHLLSLDGRQVAEEVVHEIFSRFCVGK